MSPEWMIAFDRHGAKSPGSKNRALADPLERPEWRGLQWVNTLFSRIAAGSGRQRPKSRQIFVSKELFASETHRGR
jgi:hypothetical protein